jgi:integrase/recombinase XerD
MEQQKVLWHIPDTIENRERFNITPLSHSFTSTEGIVQIEKFKQWLRSRRYSESILQPIAKPSNLSWSSTEKKPVAEITNEDVIIKQRLYTKKNNLSASYQNQIVNAIKLFFKTIRKNRN